MATFRDIIASQRPDVIAAGVPLEAWWQQNGAPELRARLAALGRQDVLNVAGNDNNWLRQWYLQNGSGEYQNIWAGNQRPQTAAEQQAQVIVDQMKAPGDFSKLYAWEQFFDPELARAAASQRTEGYYMPQFEQNIDAIRSDTAGRGLFRSGIRNRAETDQMVEMADKEQSMIEQLYAQREKEARDMYASQQSAYEKDPTGYKAPESFAQAYATRTGGQSTSPFSGKSGGQNIGPVLPSGQTDYYGYRKQQYGTTPVTNYRYGIGSVEGSPYKYGQSYRDWYKSKYNKQY